MREPVGDEERAVLGEAAAVEDEQELAAVGIEALDGVRDAGREEPEVALRHVVHELAPLGVHGGDAGAAVEHVGPLAFLVPVQLAHSARLEAHVHASQRLRDRQLPLRDLARPAAVLQPVVRVGEGELEVGKGAVVGLWRHEYVRVLAVAHGVARTRIIRTLAAAHRLRQVAGH